MTKISLTCQLDENNRTFNLGPATVNLLGEDWREKWELVRDDLKEVDFKKGEAYVEATFMRGDEGEYPAELNM